MEFVNIIVWIPIKREGRDGLPDVFDETEFDKLLVLVFVKTHEDGVIARFWPCFEVEHHGVSSLLRNRMGKERAVD